MELPVTSIYTDYMDLRGEVLPIGGLKEKLLAAHRGGIETVLIPADNEKDLAEIPKNIKDKLSIVPVKWIDEVFELALQQTPRPSRSEVVVTPTRETSVDDTDSGEATLPH